MLSTKDVKFACPDCEYSDLSRQVSFVDDEGYPERIRCCQDCSIKPSEDCIASLPLFYGMCMDCIDDHAEDLLRDCDLCQFLWRTLRTIKPLTHVCKPCRPLYDLYNELWALYGPVTRASEVEPGPDCLICIEKLKHQFLYASLHTGRVRMCWPCLRVFQHPI